MFEIKVEGHFSSAHHLLNYEGECENQHGHNWRVEVYVHGEKLDKSGILLDFKVLKQTLENVLSGVDYKDLNLLPEFEGQSPSSETIARFIYLELKKEVPGLNKVSVWETERARASYWE